MASNNFIPLYAQNVLKHLEHLKLFKCNLFTKFSINPYDNKYYLRIISRYI